eukprot:939985-Alexandrium_andersonii.AAC.1
MEARAPWHPCLSGHACLTTCPAAAARRAQDCPPHRLRGLPQPLRGPRGQVRRRDRRPRLASLSLLAGQ